MEEEKIGIITHYFGKIGVGVIKMEKGKLKIGDKIAIRAKDGTARLEQEVNSIQVEHQPVQAAKKGEDVGLKFDGEVKEGDEVYRMASGD